MFMTMWIPRGLMILFTLFITLFAFDAFEGTATPWQKVLAILMHLLPTLLLAGITWLSWSHPKPAGVLLICLSAIACFAFGTRWDTIAFFLIGLPPALAGLLFIIVPDAMKHSR